MTRRMSCSMTADAVIARRKTVTRRAPDTWKNLEPGDRLTLVRKAMGLKKGEKQEVLAEVEVVRVTVEPLWNIDEDDLAREGIDGMTPDEFCVWWMESHGIRPKSQNEAMATLCRRIEWRYL